MDALPRTALNLTLEAMVNKVLSLDPISRARLAPWQGKCLVLELSPPGVVFNLLIEAEAVRVLIEQETPPEARVKGTPLAVLRFLTPTAENPDSPPEIEMTGNLVFIEAFHGLLRDIEPDWEGEIAKYLGDVIAHSAGRRIREGIRWSRGAGRSLLADTEEFLSEEARLVPSRAEVSHQMQELPPLEQALDDLSKRIERLEQILRQSNQEESL